MSTEDDRMPLRPANADADADPGAPDAWLHAALRHAPDADVAAPPALSAAILREAAAAATATPPRPAQPSIWQTLLAAWSWLAQPPVAAGCASVMLAGVIGLMWWDKPLTEALPARAPDVAAVPLSPTVPTQDAAAPPAAQAAITPPAVEPEREAPPARAAKAPAAPSAERRRVAPGETLNKALGQARPEATADAAVEAPAGVLTDTPAVARSESAKALPDAAPATGVVPPLRDRARLAITAAAPLAAPPPAPNSSARADDPMEIIPKRSARPPEARLAAESASLLNEVRAAVRADPQRWTWQRGTGAERLMTALLQAWLDRVGDAVAISGPTSATASASGSIPAPATELRLFRDGQWHTTLALGATGLRVTSADTRRTPQQLALSPAVAAELTSALDAATTP